MASNSIIQHKLRTECMYATWRQHVDDDHDDDVDYDERKRGRKCMWTGKSLILWSSECKKSHKYQSQHFAAPSFINETAPVSSPSSLPWYGTVRHSTARHVGHTRICINQLQEHWTGGNLSLRIEYVHRNIFFLPTCLLFTCACVLVWWMCMCVFLYGSGNALQLFILCFQKEHIYMPTQIQYPYAKRWFAN